MVEIANGILYVDADMAIRNTTVISETAIEIQRRFQPDWFGVEVNQFQQLLADNIRQLANERRVLVPLYTLDNRVNKLVRIRRLTPLLSQGRLRFKGDSPGARLLVEQLRDFPNGDHDDGPDALEMAVRLAAELLSRTDDDVETILVAV
jgi:predicted phage terminase large subunit-like protein